MQETEKQIDDGGPAFPVATEYGANNGVMGLSLRDYLAAKAMQGLIYAKANTFTGAGKEFPYDDCAKHSFAMADAMIAAMKQ